MLSLPAAPDASLAAESEQWWLPAGAGHRPWPPAGRPPAMAQTWRDLLFAHWPMDVAEMRCALPAALELDTFAGQAWLGIVPFHMTGIRPFGLPSVGWLSAFAELNLRTYVTVGGKPGVYFFSLDASNPVAVALARAWYHLPYVRARMRVRCERDAIVYGSHRTDHGHPPADLLGWYRPAGPVFRSRPDTLEHWLTEHYCVYSLDRRGRTYRAEVHHAPWPLQPANAHFPVNSLPQAHGFSLPGAPPLLHFARRLDIVDGL